MAIKRDKRNTRAFEEAKILKKLKDAGELENKTPEEIRK